MAKIQELYHRIYDLICGKHPNERLWHFQWIAIKYLRDDLKKCLPQLDGQLLDVGCGSKPYTFLLTKVQEYIGIDIYEGEKVDVVIDPEKPYPFSDSSFDSIICIQVIEHISNLSLVIKEIDRVLKPGGTLIVTVPFIFNDHGDDYRRFSIAGIKELFPLYQGEAKPQGGIGSSAGILILNWIDCALSRNITTKIVKGIVLPLWILLSVIMNIVGMIFDKVDQTSLFYNNVIFIATKPLINS